MICLHYFLPDINEVKADLRPCNNISFPPLLTSFASTENSTTPILRSTTTWFPRQYHSREEVRLENPYKINGLAVLAKEIYNPKLSA